jgi:hypothetical protein
MSCYILWLGVNYYYYYYYYYYYILGTELNFHISC